MSRFWLSDLHIGHSNIIEFANRPFWQEIPINSAFGPGTATAPDVDAMNKALLDNYNDVVGPTDEAWFIGDIVMGRFETTIKSMRLFHGKKYLVPGNHDRCHKMHPKWARFLPAYEAVGFTVLDSQVMTTVGDTEVKVCHFPYRFTHPSDDRYSGLRPDDDGSTWLIHGHTHQPEPFNLDHRTIHVGVDAWDYRPVPETTIEQIIAGTIS